MSYKILKFKMMTMWGSSYSAVVFQFQEGYNRALFDSPHQFVSRGLDLIFHWYNGNDICKRGKLDLFIVDRISVQLVHDQSLFQCEKSMSGMEIAKKRLFFKQFDQQSLFVISLLVWHSFRSAKNLFTNIDIGMPMVILKDQQCIIN